MAPTTEEPVFDHAAMSDRLMGDTALMQSVAEAFLSDMPTQIAQLNDYVQAGDVQQVTSQAHKIKGASANVGGMALSALVLQMEQAGIEGDMETISQNLTELEQRFSQLKSTMAETLL